MFRISFPQIWADEEVSIPEHDTPFFKEIGLLGPQNPKIVSGARRARAPTAPVTRPRRVSPENGEKVGLGVEVGVV
jgi:hypothetical protein